MCGIAICQPADPAAIRKALSALARRGPDAQDAVDLVGASLAVARLAITDPAGGRQPIPAPGGRGWVGLNGAIYNAGQLRENLGLHPPTGNDGEVIWPLYERHGLRFADYLEGMFAICIADEERQRVVLAVDGCGIKPLFLDATWGSAFAASTLQAVPPERRRTACLVPAGTVIASDGTFAAIADFAVPNADLYDVLRDAVSRQIPADVAWGCFLSGGVDSSTIAALAASVATEVTSVTAGVDGGEDLRFARDVAASLGLNHFEAIIDAAELPRLIDVVIEATASPDASVVMGGVGTYVAARTARQHGLKVVLCGEGADELFAGYDDYRWVADDELEATLRCEQRDLGRTECLRLDRCTMAHGLEARVPFLSQVVVAKARSLPLTEKLDRSRTDVAEKLALRRVAARLLPPHIAWRQKMGFANGAGLMLEGSRLASRSVGESERRQARRLPGAQLYYEMNRFIRVDEDLATYIYLRWQDRFGDELGGWDALVERGAARRIPSRAESAVTSAVL